MTMMMLWMNANECDAYRSNDDVNGGVTARRVVVDGRLLCDRRNSAASNRSHRYGRASVMRNATVVCEMVD